MQSCKSTYDLVKIKNQSRKLSHEHNRARVERIRTFPFSSDSAYDSIVYDPMRTRLLESKAEAEG